MSLIWNFKKMPPFIYEDNGILLNAQELVNGTKMFINPGAGIKYKISGYLAASLGAGLFVKIGPNVS